MKRWTSTWAGMLVAGILAVSAPGYAQAPAVPASASTDTQSKPAAGTPQEHLQKADTAVKSITAAGLSSKTAARIAELKQHLAALETMAATTEAPSAAASTNAHAGHGGPGAQQWASEAAEADKILGELLADSPAAANQPPASDPRQAGPTGTAGSTEPADLDRDTRTKLTTVRASLMAFTAAMSGLASAPSPATTGPSSQTSQTTRVQPSGAAPASAAAAQPGPGAQAEPAAPSSTAESTAAPQGTDTQNAGTASQPSSQAAPAAGGTPAGSADTAKQALTAARDSLSQLTKLPAVQQLTGEPRTQISQLISSFNALITSTADWRGAYAKVDAQVTALVGTETASESAAATAGEAGAVNPAGAATGGLDPVLKAKLVEFRTYLKAFEKAAAATPGK